MFRVYNVQLKAFVCFWEHRRFDTMKKWYFWKQCVYQSSELSFGKNVDKILYINHEHFLASFLCKAEELHFIPTKPHCAMKSQVKFAIWRIKRFIDNKRYIEQRVSDLTGSWKERPRGKQAHKANVSAKFFVSFNSPSQFFGWLWTGRSGYLHQPVCTSIHPAPRFL